MKQEILDFCIKKGFLLDNEVLNLLSENDVESVKLILEEIMSFTQKRVITKNIFYENKDRMGPLFSSILNEKQNEIKNLEIKKKVTAEINIQRTYADSIKDEEPSVKIESFNNFNYNKLEVKNFVTYFRNRFNDIKNILQERPELENLISIDKLNKNRSNVSLIGIVSKKRATKNKNILLELEDLTGKINVLINKDKKELYEKADEVALDSIIGIKGVGSKEIFFANDLFFPEAILPERKKSPIEEYALFIGDVHFGSKRFLEKSFLRFIDYLNGKFPNTPEVEKIKYLFIVGDVVTGVGNYPNQEFDLSISDLEEQFNLFAELLSKIRSDIKIIISPGNHDGVRIMEPQPILDEKFAWALHNMKNVILTSNPSYVNIGASKNFSGFDILTYHGFSFPYYANNIPSLMLKKAMNSPEEIAKYLLKNRHLAPTHESSQYFPLEKDFLIISKIPDIFVTAHTHKSAVTYYNNILVISTSCWEAMTPYQEKFGNIPDHCKVPMVNLKTRAVKILDFEDKE